jgi:hypothetical protein
MHVQQTPIKLLRDWWQALTSVSGLTGLGASLANWFDAGLAEWQTRLYLACLTPTCQHCRQHAAAWLCTNCAQQWANPILTHHWPVLNTQVFSLHPLAGLVKKRLYGAKFYRNAMHKTWCTALLQCALGGTGYRNFHSAALDDNGHCPTPRH